ncbi:hypothetical protein F4859DRAFT_460188 [Xylaria cf. heliscus]|nr:hypothetical protein F4859DRAFT_460188 [Xylaria cf. heliscus]
MKGLSGISSPWLLPMTSNLNPITEQRQRRSNSRSRSVPRTCRVRCSSESFARAREYLGSRSRMGRHHQKGFLGHSGRKILETEYYAQTWTWVLSYHVAHSASGFGGESDRGRTGSVGRQHDLASEYEVPLDSEFAGLSPTVCPSIRLSRQAFWASAEVKSM